MTWIMLTQKLPTRPSPPKMSIFWAEPWPDDIYSVKQGSTCQECGKLVRQDDGKGTKYKGKRYARHLEGFCECDGGPVFTSPEEPYLFDSFGMKEPNWAGAMRILYAGAAIRVFPHEYSLMTPDKMQVYCVGDSNTEPSHILVPETESAGILHTMITDGDLRPIYDAALLDGCTPEQAYLTAMEIDITEQIDFPAVGWYKLHPAYAAYFCTEFEFTEHREAIPQ